MMNLADHNQDIGQSDTYDVAHAVSGDWPGYFHRRLEQDVGRDGDVPGRRTSARWRT